MLGIHHVLHIAKLLVSSYLLIPATWLVTQSYHFATARAVSALTSGMIRNADTSKSRQIAYWRVRENTPVWSGEVAGHSPFSELIALVRNYGCGPCDFTRSVEEHQAEG
jgi:hypothetical protein